MFLNVKLKMRYNNHRVIYFILTQKYTQKINISKIYIEFILLDLSNLTIYLINSYSKIREFALIPRILYASRATV